MSKKSRFQDWQAQFPLQAAGARIVNRYGQRFKLAGINWYGASDCHHVVGGLDVQCLGDICESVASMGFTVVRLPFSNQMLRVETVSDGIDFGRNPALEHLTPLEVFDCVIDALGAVGVAVVLNNHTTVGMWSGGAEANGLWYLEGDGGYTEERWIADWVFMAHRYRNCPHVVGYDLRNEVRPSGLYDTVAGGPSWGLDGGEGRDWREASGRCARSIIAEPDLQGLIFVERIAWPQNSLADMLNNLPWDVWNVPRERIALAVHMYSWSGPGFWSPKHFVGGPAWGVLTAIDLIGRRSLYGEMTEEDLYTQMSREWGFCIEQGLCPVWLSEFGIGLDDLTERLWFDRVCNYLQRLDADFAYWPLNVGRKPGGEGSETYGMLSADWRPRWGDPRLRTLSRLCPEAGFARRPEVPCLHWWRGAQLPLVCAPSPWCAPLPGPLIRWPHEGDSNGIPQCKYLWTRYDGYQVSVVDTNSVQAVESLVSIMQECTDNGYSGFAWSDDHGMVCMAHASAGSSSSLREWLHYRFPNTSVFLLEEFRLCAMFTDLFLPYQEAACVVDDISTIGVTHDLPDDAEPSKIQEICEWLVLSLGFAGYEVPELPDDMHPKHRRSVRLLAHADVAKVYSATRALQRPCMKPKPHASRQSMDMQSLPGTRLTRILECMVVRTDLEMFPAHDSFPGCSARILEGATLVACRQLCLAEGYGGFLMCSGAAHFRAASPVRLRENLVVAEDAGCCFYVLRVEELQPEDALPDDLSPQLFGSSSASRKPGSQSLRQEVIGSFLSKLTSRA